MLRNRGRLLAGEKRKKGGKMDYKSKNKGKKKLQKPRGGNCKSGENQMNRENWKKNAEPRQDQAQLLTLVLPGRESGRSLINLIKKI